ncbi:MAG: hypothetical protein CVT94_04495 [Bacteroidetes bacterium HGW-Bacteroidetes-11]|jgi:hypothetical protein|nr:MAG: hypothetical protein CVT94_04495 [Bacteroidetes bacterium HGW-Bacteroidetes-11]
MKSFCNSVIVSLFAILFLASCNPKQRSKSAAKNEIDTAYFKQQGDSISAIMQQVLLSNVMKATKAGGPVYAVAFCNERAMPLTDSLSQKYNCQIQRISDKYRNPANKPSKDDEDVLLRIGSSNSGESVLVSGNGKVVYYKPIRIAMPSCLNCHGNRLNDIAPKTFEVIQQKYPGDLATGYKEGDFRGLWKITFPEE